MTSQAHRHKDIPKAYDPRAVEERLYRFWEESGYFMPRIDPKRKPFTKRPMIAHQSREPQPTRQD